MKYLRRFDQYFARSIAIKEDFRERDKIIEDMQLEDEAITFVGVATAAKSATQAADEARGSYRPPQSDHTYGRR